MLIQTYGYGIEGDFNSVYRMNVETGMLNKVATSPVRDGTFVTDFDNRVAFVYGNNREGNTQTFLSRAPIQRMEAALDGSDEEGWIVPIAPWNRTGSEFLMMNNRDAPTRGIFQFAPEAGTSKLLFREPDVDVGGVRTDPTGKPWMFSYQNHFTAYWYPDPQHPLARTHQWLRESCAASS